MYIRAALKQAQFFNSIEFTAKVQKKFGSTVRGDTVSVTYVSVEILDQGGKSRIIQGEFSSSSDERDWEIVNREDQGKIHLCTVEDPYYNYSRTY